MSIDTLVYEAKEKLRTTVHLSAQMLFDQYRDTVVPTLPEDCGVLEVAARAFIFATYHSYLAGYEDACIDILENSKH